MLARLVPAAVLVAATVISSASPAAAQGYRYYSDGCTDRIHNNGTTGAIIGGIAGAVIGSNLAAHHSGRTGGALLGGAAGAAIGNNVARSSTKESCRGRRHEYRAGYRRYDYPAYGYAEPYYGGGYVPSGYYSGYGYVGPHDDHGRHWHGHHHHHHDDDDDDD